jgi:hypothetical protein
VTFAVVPKNIREIRPIRAIRVKSSWAFERITYILTTTFFINIHVSF